MYERLQGHTRDYKRYQHKKYHYVKSFDILEKENYEIQLLEEVKCKTKKELLEREGYYIKKYRDICVNKCIAGRTQEQYYKDNVDKIREASKQYYKDNMVKIKEQREQYRNDKFDCICGGRFTRSNKICHEKTKKHILFKNI